MYCKSVMIISQNRHSWFSCCEDWRRILLAFRRREKKTDYNIKVKILISLLNKRLFIVFFSFPQQFFFPNKIFFPNLSLLISLFPDFQVGAAASSCGLLFSGFPKFLPTFDLLLDLLFLLHIVHTATVNRFSFAIFFNFDLAPQDQGQPLRWHCNTATLP